MTVPTPVSAALSYIEGYFDPKSMKNLSCLGRQKRFLSWWGKVDSNHRRQCQQIYSLSPLATREFPHIRLLADVVRCTVECFGAGRRTRTPDLLITNQLLYQLSYTSVSKRAGLLYKNRRGLSTLFLDFLRFLRKPTAGIYKNVIQSAYGLCYNMVCKMGSMPVWLRTSVKRRFQPFCKSRTGAHRVFSRNGAASCAGKRQIAPAKQEFIKRRRFF